MGERGARPVIFPVAEPRERLAHVLAVPGTGWYPGAVLSSWDSAWRIAELLNFQNPKPPIEWDEAELRARLGVTTIAPGMARYDVLGFREILRQYQKEAVMFFLWRAWAVLALPMRTGKCLVSIAADIAVDSRWTLIVAPSLVKWVWAEELAKWAKTSAIILEGRGGREAKKYCLTCDGRGLTKDGDRCSACKQLNGQSYGYNIVEVRTVSKPVRAPHVDTPKPRVGTRRREPQFGVRLNLIPRERPIGPRYPNAVECEAIEAATKEWQAQFDDGNYQCSKHPEVRSKDPKSLCMKCREELLREIKSARYVITNYDILVAQDLYDEAGGLIGQRLDLPGWAPILQRVEFDVAILDEAHVLRGRPEKKRRGKARRSRLIEALARVRRVWALSGTPVFGYTRDLWGPLDICSNGLFGRPWYDFDERYCEGKTNTHGGWDSKGRSMLAETELVKRLSHVMLKRERSEILKELPPKERVVIRVEPKAHLPKIRFDGSKRDVISRELGLTLEHKLDKIVDDVIETMLEGNCVLVFCYLRKSAERVYQAIDAAMRNAQVAPALRRVNAQTWLAHGEVSDKARFDLSRVFRDHAANRCAGAFVSTIDAMQVGISLKGASSVHFAELHHSPAAMLQAEDRPYEVGTTGLSVVYYSVVGSIDEHAIDGLTSKYETLILLTGEEGAKDAKRALTGVDDDEVSIEDMWRRLTAHLE